MDARIGERIRRYREAREMSPEDLARAAGITPLELADVEAGEESLAIGPLVKAARALGVRLGTFMDDVQTEDPHIMRAETIEAQRADRNPGEKQAYVPLGQGKADRNMEPFFMELFPGQGPAELSSHEGEEFIIVVCGKVRLTYGKQEHILSKGDSMYYNSVVPHQVAAYGDEPAQIHAVIYVPF
ncbi:MAG: XRE family transcriptional regulator [Desulfovibrio sp.]|nr:MAG: XRE family transcriptional regulator [Desulfovibrio sp.]